MKTQNIVLLALAAAAIWYFIKKKKEATESTPATPETEGQDTKNKYFIPDTGSGVRPVQDTYKGQDTTAQNVEIYYAPTPPPGAPATSTKTPGFTPAQSAEMLGIY